MTAASLRRRLAKLEQGVRPAPSDPSRRLDAALKQPGIWDRLWRIAEHGAAPDDMEWLDDQSKATGVNLHDVVRVCVDLNEEY